MDGTGAGETLFGEVVVGGRQRYLAQCKPSGAAARGDRDKMPGRAAGARPVGQADAGLGEIDPHRRQWAAQTDRLFQHRARRVMLPEPYQRMTVQCGIVCVAGRLAPQPDRDRDRGLIVALPKQLLERATAVGSHRPSAPWWIRNRTAQAIQCVPGRQPFLCPGKRVHCAISRSVPRRVGRGKPRMARAERVAGPDWHRWAAFSHTPGACRRTRTELSLPGARRPSRIDQLRC